VLLHELEKVLCLSARNADKEERASTAQCTTLARAIYFLGEKPAVRELVAMRKAMPFTLTKALALELIKVYQ
jgi:hypothetical protein